MPKSDIPEIIKKARTRVNDNALDERLNIIFKISGGVPSKRIEYEFRLSGDGKIKALMSDDLYRLSNKEAVDMLGKKETRSLIENILAGSDEIVPLPKAKFVPDSLVGSITIEIDGESARFFFHPEEKKEIISAKGLPNMTKAAKIILEKTHQMFNTI
jgi:hypothetical protein